MKPNKPTAWQLPVVVVALMMSVPGVLPEASTSSKMMFMLVGLLTWVVTECWGQNVATALLTMCRDAVMFFVARESQRTRVCIAMTGIACSSYAITVGDFWINKPPDSLAGLFFLSVIWIGVEVFRISARMSDERWTEQAASSEPQYAVYDP